MMDMQYSPFPSVCTGAPRPTKVTAKRQNRAIGVADQDFTFCGRASPEHETICNAIKRLVSVLESGVCAGIRSVQTREFTLSIEGQRLQ